MSDGIVLLLALGGVVAVSLAGWIRRRFVERRELQRYADELSTLANVGRAIAQSRLDVDALCELIYEQASLIVDTSSFQIGLFEDQFYDIRLWIRAGERREPARFDLSRNAGLVGWIQQTRQTVLVHDFERELETLPARPRYISDTPPRSSVFVPILAAEAVVGVIAIQNDRPNAFTDEHVRLVTIIANQAAPVIANARLLAIERRRVLQLQMIAQVSRQVAAILDLDELFDRVVELIQSAFNYYSVSIIIRQEESDTVVIAGTTAPQIKGRESKLGEGIIGSVVQSGEVLLANDVSLEPKYHLLDSLPETRSELAVPLIFGDQVLGALNVESSQVDAFTLDDVYILRTLADQVVIAIHEARLYAAEREQAWISTALLQVAEAAVQATSLDEVLETVTRITPLLSGVDRCGIMMWDNLENAYRPAQSFGLDERTKVFDALRVTYEQALELPLVQANDEIARSNGLPEWVSGAFGSGSVLTFPLYARGELAGIMLVGAQDGIELSDHKAMLLTGIANQAAMAIESAQLLVAQREEAWVSNALLHVAEAVGSQTELNDILTTVVRLTPMMIGVDVCMIFLLDESSRVLNGASAYGLSRDRLPTFESIRIPSIDWPFEEDRSVIPDQVCDLLGLRAPQAWPLQAKDDIAGAMVIDGGTEVLARGTRRANILTGIVSQTAVAIVNSRLADEISARERLEQELRLARGIQESFLPEHAPEVQGWQIAAYWRSARQVGGDFYDFIRLGGDQNRLGIAIADVADKGVPAALFMALSRTLLRAVAIGRQSPADTLMRSNDLILSDARSDLFVTVFYMTLSADASDISYANAGHNPPLLIRAIDPKPSYLLDHGMALGVMRDIPLGESVVDLQEGDVLVLYTDGVTDAQSIEEEEFGLKRLEQAVQSCIAGTAKEIVQAVEQAIHAHVGDEMPFDDITLVVVKCVSR